MAFIRGTHFSSESLDSSKASNPQSDHAHRMYLSELLELTRPPDSELVDLIDWASLEGQNDGQKAELACLELAQISGFRARVFNQPLPKFGNFLA